MLMYEDKFYDSYIHSQPSPDHHGKGFANCISVGDALKDSSIARVFSTAAEPYTILHVNDAWCALFGFRPEEALGRSLPAFQASEVGISCNMFKALEQGPGTTHELEVAHASGRRILCRQSVIPLQSPASFVGVLLVETAPCNGEVVQNVEPRGHDASEEVVEMARRCGKLSLSHGMDDDGAAMEEPASQSSGFDFDFGEEDEDSELEEEWEDPSDFVAYSLVELPLPSGIASCEVEQAMEGLQRLGLLRSCEVVDGWAALSVDLETLNAHLEECGECARLCSCGGGGGEGRGDALWAALLCLERYLRNGHEDLIGASDLGFLAE